MAGLVQDWTDAASKGVFLPKFADGEMVMTTNRRDFHTGATIENPAIIEHSFYHAPLSSRPSYGASAMETGRGNWDRTGEISHIALFESELRKATPQDIALHSANFEKIRGYISDVRHEQELESVWQKEQYAAGYSAAIVALDRTLAHNSPIANPQRDPEVERAIVHDAAIDFSESIARDEKRHDYGSLRDDNPYFEQGQRKAVMDWSHQHNHELKQQGMEFRNDERKDRFMSKTVQGFTSPEPRAEEYSRDRNRELFESAERKVISNIGESYPGISEDLQRFVDYVKAVEPKLLPPEIYSRAAELHSADIVAQRRSEDKSREQETPQEQQDKGISW